MKFVAFIFGFIAFGALTSSSDVSDSFEADKIVPDVVTTAPVDLIKVSYAKVIVSLGNELMPVMVKDAPTVEWTADPDSFYTLVMTDPDAPSRADPKYREWHHWIVSNIPGNNVADGETLTQYVGAGPPQGTGLHRYVFLVYKQSGKLEFDEPRLTNRSGKNRAKFSVQSFAEKYNMGDPIAGNYFQAEWDDYVPTLYAQLKD